MSEIFNLHTLCRCCHKDGKFRSLQLCYVYETELEMYATMLRETFNINMNMPTIDASNSICDDCIKRLRDAASFKRQVLDCEQKFQLYCKNEQALIIKEEITYDYDDDNNDKDSVEEGNLVVDESYNDDTQCKAEHPDESSVKDCKPEGNYYWEVKIEDEWEQTETVIQNPNNTEDREVKESVRKKMRKTIKDKVQKNVMKSEKKIKLVPENESLVDTDKGQAYKCNICGNTYTALGSLRKHIQKRHDVTYKCTICDTTLSDRAKYIAHKKTHPKRWSCQFCSKTYNNVWSCKQHENTHTQEVQYQCDICKKSFAYKLTLTRHILGHYGRNKKFVCDICGLTFSDTTNMRMHVLTVHHKVRPFKCTVCPKSFTFKKHLTVHFRDHTGERPFTCEVCLLSFKSSTTLKRHIQQHHNEKLPQGSRKFTCKICSQEFERRGQLQSHMRTHIGQKEFKCHICVRDFCSSFTLKRHIDEHNGIKQFVCEICNTRFTQKTQLLRHNRRFHDPNRIIREKVKCDLCNVYFRDLEKHMNTHNKRPFACELCNKRYPEKNTLNRHIKHVHVGVKEHACTMCDKQYAKKSNLKSHILKVHKDMKQEET
ncbi:uncharacterized protein [Epargyreus clarus]|uniref:uncharacterized protein isoform X1 n=1 Tax=Epargyreus clarus TaxID=520877 RepID=UPI003C2FEDE7